MKILAFDTALDACSAALWSDGTVLARESVAAARGHAEILFPMLERVLDSAGLGYGDIDRFAVTIGPGSFTGVRVGVAAARGLALGLGKPAFGITTLEAIAATAVYGNGAMVRKGQEKVAAAIDARRGEIYFQVFAAGGSLQDLTALTAPAAVTPDEAARLLGAEPALLAGSGAGLVKEYLEDRGDVVCATTGTVPDAGVLVGLAAMRALDTEAPPPSPLYLRPPDAKLPASARSAGL